MHILKSASAICLLAIAFSGCSKPTTTTPPPATSFTCRGGGLFYWDDSSNCSLAGAFTPNGDGINDLYNPLYENITAYNIEISDKSGTKMYTSTDPATGWDGKHNGADAPQGYYDVKISFTSKKTGPHNHAYEITLYRYSNPGGCLKNGDVNKCRFLDQMHPRFGFDYFPTDEVICP